MAAGFEDDIVGVDDGTAAVDERVLMDLGDDLEEEVLVLPPD